jgi:hypothetical protein
MRADYAKIGGFSQAVGMILGFSVGSAQISVSPDI